MKRKGLLSLFLIVFILLSTFNFTLAVGVDNLTEYNMELKLNEEKHILEGKQDVVFVNTYEDSLNELVFHLYPDAYESYETLPTIGIFYFEEMDNLPQLSEEEKGYIDIEKVYIDGKYVEYKEKDQVLKIFLKEPIKQGQEVNITIEFTLKIPLGQNRLHYMNDVYSLTNWYPILSIYDEETNKWDERPYHPIGESNYSDVSNYTVKITVPKDMVLVPTGKIVKESVYEKSKTVTIRAEKVRDFVIMMSPKYKAKTTEVDGIKIDMYYLDDRSEDIAKAILDEVAKTVEFMNHRFGRYAYDELKMAETYLSGGAMEYPQVIQFGKIGAFFEDINIEEKAPWIIEAAVHEAIHQWWYVGVGSDEFSEPFLDESLTVFTTAYYFENQYGKFHENGVNYVIRQSLYNMDKKPINTSVDDFTDWGEYSRIIYEWGPKFFEDLRQRVGEDKFVEILRSYYERYLYKNATIEDLLKLITELAGEEVGKAMHEAVTESDYNPINIALTPEEEKIIRIRWEIKNLRKYEEMYGLVIGSITLNALEGEDLIIVKPEYVKEGDSYNVEQIINSIKDNFLFNYGIEVKVVDENKLNEEDKKANLIIIGYPEKSSIIKEINSELPMDLLSKNIEIGKVSIEREEASGMFISKNPYNENSVYLIIFLSEKTNEDETELVKSVTGGDGEQIIIYDSYISDKFNIFYVNDHIQFIIYVDDIEVKGINY